MKKSLQPKIIEKRFELLKKTDLDEIIKTYKIVEVPYLDPVVVEASTKNDIYFVIFSKKKELLNNMVNYYLTHNDSLIYKKTNYFCNELSRVCICNTSENDFKKSMEYINKSYFEPVSYISWSKNVGDKF
jgi:hypothetical protein